jgi:tRNA uridine 5-carboxymethylaminomethyl modification enzyme
MNMQTIAQMSCNPAMGGIAKGQIVREVDAMGGYSGIVSDASMIQFRMLNRSKGPCYVEPKDTERQNAICSKVAGNAGVTPNVDFYQDMVKELVVEIIK